MSTKDTSITAMRKRYLTKILEAMRGSNIRKMRTSDFLKISFILDPRKSCRDFEKKASPEQVQETKRIFRCELKGTDFFTLKRYVSRYFTS